MIISWTNTLNTLNMTVNRTALNAAQVDPRLDLIYYQGSINCMQRDFCIHKITSRKSIKSPLISTPRLFKVMSYFLCLKARNIQHSKI